MEVPKPTDGHGWLMDGDDNMVPLWFDDDCLQKLLIDQCQLLKGAKFHIYLYCFTFVYIDLNRALVIIVLFPKNYRSKKVCANGIGK